MATKKPLTYSVEFYGPFETYSKKFATLAGAKSHVTRTKKKHPSLKSWDIWHAGKRVGG